MCWLVDSRRSRTVRREPLSTSISCRAGRHHNLDALAGALRAANARLRVPGAESPVEVPLDGSTLRHYEVSTWRTDHGDIDVVVGTPKKDSRAARIIR